MMHVDIYIQDDSCQNPFLERILISPPKKSLLEDKASIGGKSLYVQRIANVKPQNLLILKFLSILWAYNILGNLGTPI